MKEEFDKDKARDEFFKTSPDFEKYMALDKSTLKKKVAVEKRRTDSLLAKSLIVQELLSIRELNIQLKKELTEKMIRERKPLQEEYQRIRMRDYVHEKLSKRKDFKAMQRERNRLAKQRKEGKKRLAFTPN